MKKLIPLILICPVLVFADNVATTPSLSVLQNQLTQLQQQVQNDQQTVEAVSQDLTQAGNQIGILQKQINQYGNASLSQFKWVDVNNNALPQNAYVAASNGGVPLNICQANYPNAGGNYYGGGNNLVIDPGVVTSNGCVITYGGQAYLIPQYSVLTSNVAGYWISGDYIKSNTTQPPILPLQMVRVNKGGNELPNPSAPPVSTNNEPIPLYNALAIVGGQENGNNIYICRAQINGQYFVGKVANNTCYIATGKYEATWPVYEVLLTRKP